MSDDLNWRSGSLNRGIPVCKRLASTVGRGKSISRIRFAFLPVSFLFVFHVIRRHPIQHERMLAAR